MSYRKNYKRQFGQFGVDVALGWPEEAIITRKGKKKHTLGLALSGQGCSAAIYNYGILKGLYEIGLINQLDYLSVTGGASWSGLAFAITEELDRFFAPTDNQPTLLEEGFASLLPDPPGLAQEIALNPGQRNHLSDLYGRLLARAFLREHGHPTPLADRRTIKEHDRPFLIINGTVYFHPTGSFSALQEGFEMTRLYCGSHSLGYLHSKYILSTQEKLRIQDAMAISGAGNAIHIPPLGSQLTGLGLSREITNYAKKYSATAAKLVNTDYLALADGSLHNNLGVEALINRGCKYIILVDAGYDPEQKTDTRSNQGYQALHHLLKKTHLPLPLTPAMISQFDRADEAIHLANGSDNSPDILYIKLKTSSQFNTRAATTAYNRPDFPQTLWRSPAFAFNPHYSPAKLAYTFAEHRNLSELGRHTITEHQAMLKEFAHRSE